jgi:hypothetical protein
MNMLLTFYILLDTFIKASLTDALYINFLFLFPGSFSLHYI